MARVQYTLYGISEAIAAIQVLRDGPKSDELTDKVVDTANKLIDEMRANAPVFTGPHTPPGHEPGTLRDRGIGRNVIRHSEAGRTSVYIGFTQVGWYGIFPEFGTIYMAARPFMIPAFERMQEQMVDGIADAFSSVTVEAVTLR